MYRLSVLFYLLCAAAAEDAALRPLLVNLLLRLLLRLLLLLLQPEKARLPVAATTSGYCFPCWRGLSSVRPRREESNDKRKTGGERKARCSACYNLGADRRVAIFLGFSFSILGVGYSRNFY